MLPGICITSTGANVVADWNTIRSASKRELFQCDLRTRRSKFVLRNSVELINLRTAQYVESYTARKWWYFPESGDICPKMAIFARKWRYLPESDDMCPKMAIFVRNDERRHEIVTAGRIQIRKLSTVTIAILIGEGWIAKHDASYSSREAIFLVTASPPVRFEGAKDAFFSFLGRAIFDHFWSSTAPAPGFLAASRSFRWPWVGGNQKQTTLTEFMCRRFEVLCSNCPTTTPPPAALS